jgi:hypothetical protein
LTKCTPASAELLLTSSRLKELSLGDYRSTLRGLEIAAANYSLETLVLGPRHISTQEWRSVIKNDRITKLSVNTVNRKFVQELSSKSLTSLDFCVRKYDASSIEKVLTNCPNLIHLHVDDDERYSDSSSDSD